MNKPWLLPEGVDELLPQQAEYLEQLRRQLLDPFHSHGYELVMTPMIEYLDSLLVGTGNDLDLQTFKLTDQLSGRLMGARADITPQVARIDAHRLGRETPTRLCYLGTVLHTRALSQGGSRTPLQVGAELYGHAGIESDAEILCLMLTMLAEVGLEDLYLDLGHVGIFRGLSKQAGLTTDQEQFLFNALQRKAQPEIACYLAELAIPAELAEMIQALAELNGNEQIIEQARVRLAKAGAEVHCALDDLQNIAAILKQRGQSEALHFDLAELRGYHYHTGLVFAAYAQGAARAVAQGGRYDDIGKAFGRARPATGFSADLRELVNLLAPQSYNISAIFAPSVNDPALHAQIKQLREQGERVIETLPGQQGGARAMGCDRILVNTNGTWTVTEAENN